MKHYLFLSILISFFFFHHLHSQNIEKDVLMAIEKADKYDQLKVNRIKDLKKDKKRLDLNEVPLERYELYERLYEEYKVFKEDSAFHYALKLVNISRNLDSLPLIAASNFKLGEVSVSGGMYKEAVEYLSKIDIDNLPQNMISLYYGLYGRLYDELEVFNNIAYFTPKYSTKAHSYRLKALESTEENTFFNSFLKNFIRYKDGNLEDSRQAFRKLLEGDLDLQEEALVHYTMGEIDYQLNKKEKSIYHFSKSLIANIKNSTKENLSILRLAELYFEEGDLEIASKIIGKANEDATFYGAKQRKVSVGSILPIIEKQLILQKEKERHALHQKMIIISIFGLVVLLLAAVIYFQMLRLKKSRNIIDKRNQELKRKNERIILAGKQIEQKNGELELLNTKLIEANKIKENYIGYYVNETNKLFDKFKTFKRRVEIHLKEKNLKKIKETTIQVNLRKEQVNLIHKFDEIFLGLFPDFVEEFNDLLLPEERITLKKNQLLNKELRIFALMRLGIQSNNDIANILGYSVNSIYTYKTLVRKKSMLDRNEFDQKLMENTTLYS